MGDKTRFVLVLAAIIALINVAYSASEDSQYYKGVVNASEIFKKISKGELYIFVIDFNGTTLAQPYRPDHVGKSQMDLEDANGILFFKNI